MNKKNFINTIFSGFPQVITNTMWKNPQSVDNFVDNFCITVV